MRWTQCPLTLSACANASPRSVRRSPWSQLESAFVSVGEDRNVTSVMSPSLLSALLERVGAQGWDATSRQFESVPRGTRSTDRSGAKHQNDPGASCDLECPI